MSMHLLGMFLALSLCGCSASLQTRLDHAKPPEALVLSSRPLSEDQRRAEFEAHRGCVNDIGVQIGRRHFDPRQLSDYFKRSGLEAFARDAETLEWGRKAKEKARDLEGGYKGIDLGGLGGGMSGYDALAMVGFGLAIELVGAVVYQGWRLVAEAELRELSRKPGNFHGSSADLVEQYNKLLALSLGVSPTASAIFPMKAFPPPWPVKVAMGVNAEREDWVDDYSLETDGIQWFFGGHKIDRQGALDIYWASVGKQGAKYSLDSNWNEFVKACNSNFRLQLFPESQVMGQK